MWDSAFWLAFAIGFVMGMSSGFLLYTAWEVFRVSKTKAESNDKKQTQGIRGIQGVVGPKGPPGDAGPIGPIGLTGDEGDIGDRGAKGDSGDRGKRGDTGARGPRGKVAKWWDEDWVEKHRIRYLFFFLAIIQLVITFVIWQSHKANDEFQKCIYSYNQQNSQISIQRATLLKDWMQTWVPLLSTKPGEQPDPQAVKMWKDALHAFLETPIPTTPQQSCGIPPS